MAYIGATPGLTILSINDLLDVNTDSPNHRDLLVFDSATSEYIGRQLNTTDVGEGSNLYYTRIRFDSDIADPATIAAVRSYFSAGGDLIYDSNTGIFSFDVEQIYTQANFDSDFNTSLDAAALGGVGLTYDSATNTLSITDTGVASGTYGSASSIPVLSVNAQGQIDSIGTVSVAGVSGVEYDSANGVFTVTTSAGTSFSDSITLSPFTTTDLSEGNNLYYTTARADSDTLAYLTTNSYATETYVDNSINAVLDNAPAALDTLNELAAAINDDSNFAGTVTTALGTKLNISNFDSSFDTRLATKSTTNLSEGNNLYYTKARTDSDIDAAFLAKSTTDLSEGTNKYYTDERVDDRVANLLVGGAGINVSYNDSNNLLEIRVDSAPEVGYDLSANTTDDLSEGISNFYYTKSRVDSDVAQGFTDRTTSDLEEGTNLYYTTGRVDSDFDARLATKSTSNVSEGNNLYYTTARVDSDIDAAFVAKSTDNLSEGSSNLYYTTSRADSDFDIRLATKSTSNLSEGNNLYYTTARADSDISSYLTANSYATETYVTNSINGVLDNAPAALDTLNELAAAINDDSNFAGTVTASLATKLNISNFDSSFDTRLATKSTTNLSEGNNLYYTTARADSDAKNAISVTDNGGDGSLSYSSTTGVFTYTGPSASEVRSHFSANGDLSYDSGTGIFSLNVEQVYTKANFDSDLGLANTGQLPEGSNLYYTTARADSDFDARLATKSTSDVSEGNNLYYTTGRVDSDIDARVTKTFVDNLNVDADTLDGQDGSYYLNYNNFTNTPNVLDSANVKNIFSASGDISYNSGTGEFTATTYKTADFDSDFGDKTTSELSEGSNLYYTRVRTDSDIQSYLVSNSYTTETYVDSNITVAINNLVNGAPLALDTLNELATALQDDSDALAALTTVVDTKLNSSQVTSLVDSAYVQLRQDYAYSSLTGVPTTVSTFANDANYLDSTTVQGVIDQSYVTGLINATYLDSGEVISLVDSAYVQARQDFAYSSLTGVPTSLSQFANDTNYLDSVNAISLIDSAYVAARTPAVDLSSYATQTYVDSSINVILDGAPAALDTLNELAAAINDDSNFASSITTSLATKLNIADFDSSFDTRLATKSTSDIEEGVNLYYTTARVDSDFDVRLATKTTDNLSEGTVNIYYTTSRHDSDFAISLAASTTDNVSEGSTNLYYTAARVDSDIQSYLVSNSYATQAYVDSNITVGISSASVGDLSDVNISGIAEGQVLSWDSDTSKFTAGSGASQETTVNTSGLTTQVIDSWSKSTYRSAEYHIAVSSNSGFHSSKIMILHNHSNAYISQYSVLGDSIGTFTADIDPTVGVRLLLTPLDSAAEVQFTKITLTAGTSGAALSALESVSDLDSGTGTTDLMNGVGILDLSEPAASAENLNTDLLSGETKTLDLYDGNGIIDLDPTSQPVSGDLETNTVLILDLESGTGNQDLME